MKLYESRGIETVSHKIFMRLTVLFFDLAIFFTATILLSNKISKKTASSGLLLLNLLNPTLLIIDHGHFQYNSVSLGFMLLAVSSLISQGRNKRIVSMIFGSVWFSLALNYKQMELYHALPFFFYILSSCVMNREEKINYR